jgi:hypothetical protein
MKLYHEIVTRDAEVRIGERWVYTDATALVRGDIIKLRVSAVPYTSLLEALSTVQSIYSAKTVQIYV